jgi:uncharacterized membrane protein YgdD (TMEM256/DUF423 family)
MMEQAGAAPTLRRRLLILSTLFGALAVLAGAFGAHALSGRVAPRMLDVWATAVRYQMWHVFALLAAVALREHLSLRTLRIAGHAWLAGTVLFCGSLYLLVVSGITVFGAVTPIGGSLLTTGWLLFALCSLLFALCSLLFALAAWRGPDIAD